MKIQTHSGGGKAEAKGKPKGYWKSAHVLEILKAFLYKEISEESAALELGCTEADIRWHSKDALSKGQIPATEKMLQSWTAKVKAVKKELVVFDEAVKGLGESAKTLSAGFDLANQYGIPLHVLKAKAKKAKTAVEMAQAYSVDYVPQDMLEDEEVRGGIKWATYLALEKEDSWDLRTICAMFYASERIANFKGDMPWHVQAQFYSVKSRSIGYVTTWAERFAKYALAACLGEFRHRATPGNWSWAPKYAKSRAAAQAAAMKLWPDRKKTLDAVEVMTVAFKDKSYFSGHGFGGSPWSKIAATLAKWLKREIPDIVWADYVWDLSHNGGRFFDKCHLFKNEEQNRALLTAKATSKSGDVRTWGKDLLHADWLLALDMIEMSQLSKEERGY